jgi:hypothetical protein
MIKVWRLEAQFGGPPGGVYCASARPVNGVLPALPYVQNLTVPNTETIVHATGSITLKQPNSALLFSLIANGSTIWQAEFQTVDCWMVNVPFPATWNLNGQFWFDAQTYNGSGIDQGDGGLWEVQLILFGK